MPVIFSFEDFELDTKLLELRKGREAVKIEPKAFQLLQYLIENRDRAVSRDELLDVVWHGLFVGEGSISSAIKSARQAIQDGGEAQKFIKTLRGHGYRFVADVQMSGHASSVSSQDESRDPEPAGLSSQPSIVTLPFDLIGDPSSDMSLPLALSHDIIQALSRLRWLRVIARATAFQFNCGLMGELRQSLHVDYALAGTVERRDQNLIITVELNDLRRDTVIWIDRFEGKFDDIHSMRMQIVQKTISTFESRISQHEARFAAMVPTEQLDAWSAFHLGLTRMYRFTDEGNQQALALFDRAIALDPNFAKAYAGRSFAHFQNAFNSYVGTDRKTEVERAFRSADRSLELDELDHFGNFVRGRANWLTGDFEQGLDWVMRSIEINPNFAQGYYTGGVLGVLSGAEFDFEEASERSISLSPLDPLLYGFRGVRALGYLTARKYSDAATWANKSANSPGSLPVMDLVALIANDLAGNTNDAKRWAQRIEERGKPMNARYFFNALPFRDPYFQDKAKHTLQKYGF